MVASGKITKGIFLGAVAGAIDILPMIFQNLSWDANLSAFAMWVATGFFIATSDLKLQGHWKGLFVSILLLIPVAILVGWKEPASLVPMAAMTLVLGSLLGHFIEK